MESGLAGRTAGARGPLGSERGSLGTGACGLGKDGSGGGDAREVTRPGTKGIVGDRRVAQASVCSPREDISAPWGGATYNLHVGGQSGSDTTARAHGEVTQYSPRAPAFSRKQQRTQACLTSLQGSIQTPGVGGLDPRGRCH